MLKINPENHGGWEKKKKKERRRKISLPKKKIKPSPDNHLIHI